MTIDRSADFPQKWISPMPQLVKSSVGWNGAIITKQNY